MRFKVLLSNLSFFKHIFITAVYCCNADAWTAGKNRQRRSQLFQYILKTIIQQSKSSLDTLDINIYDADNVINSALNKPEFNVLLYIMKEFDQLSISKLIWDRDYFKPSTNCTMSQMLQQIQTQFVITFPKLTSFIISPKWKFVSSGPTGAALAVSARHIPATLKQYILAPLIHDVASSLESMEIPYQNIGVIPLIAEHMINLKTLTISAAYETTHSPVIDISGLGMIKHIMLKKMTVDLWMWSNMKNRGRDVTNNLRYLFSTFIGITEFEFCFLNHTGSDTHYVDWFVVLDALVHNKRMYCMNKGEDAVLPLESLQLKCISYEEGEYIIKALFDLNYLHLKHIGLTFERYGWKVTDNFAKFVTNWFLPFLKLYHNAKLKHVTLVAPGYNDEPSNLELEFILNVLDNLPVSLKSIHFELPTLDTMMIIPVKRDDIEYVKFVKKLCQMSLETNAGNLENITFDGIKMPHSLKLFLSFWFGFRNKITIV
eukprot:137862_1